MENTNISTKETQEIIYRRRVKRLKVTKGISRGKLINRINKISKVKKKIR